MKGIIMNKDDRSGQRTIVINGNFDKNSAGEIIDFIMLVNEEEIHNSLTLKDYKVKPIKMIMNSIGGFVYDGFAVIGAIECSVVPVEVIHMGLTASTALVVGVTGHHRVAHRYARFMYHELAYGNIGKLAEKKLEQEEADNIQELIDSHIAERTKISKDVLAKVRDSRCDWYFSADEALKLGVVDEIISEPILQFDKDEPKRRTKTKKS
jgi:ATP-dependent Clp protease, protease subunit